MRPKAKILFVTSETVYPLPSERKVFRIPGSWSWTMTTVPADAPSVVAVADGPSTRLAKITSAPHRSKIERLRMYSLHPSDALQELALAPVGSVLPRHRGVEHAVASPPPSRFGYLERHDQVQDHSL